MNGFKKYLGIMMLVIFTGGLLIYAWRSLHGDNLAKAPKFDLSVYEDTSWYDRSMEQVYDRFIKPANEATLPQLEQEISSGADALKVDPEFMYFKRSFCDFVGAEALPAINNFLSKFPELQGRAVEFVIEPAEYCAKVSMAGGAEMALLKGKIQKDYGDFVVIK